MTFKAVKTKAQHHLHRLHRVHHFADLAYLSTTFIENTVVHHFAVGVLIVVVSTFVVIGEEPHS